VKYAPVHHRANLSHHHTTIPLHHRTTAPIRVTIATLDRICSTAEISRVTSVLVSLSKPHPSQLHPTQPAHPTHHMLPGCSRAAAYDRRRTFWDGSQRSRRFSNLRVKPATSTSLPPLCVRRFVANLRRHAPPRWRNTDVGETGRARTRATSETESEQQRWRRDAEQCAAGGGRERVRGGITRHILATRSNSLLQDLVPS